MVAPEMEVHHGHHGHLAGEGQPISPLLAVAGDELILITMEFQFKQCYYFFLGGGGGGGGTRQTH